MSGFITTMFVSSPSSPHLAFPAKSKPLLPIFTFAESQSCMNLRMHLDELDSGDWDLCTDSRHIVENSRTGLDLERPRRSQSPLQRIGEALRTQDMRSNTRPSTPMSPFGYNHGESPAPSPPVCEKANYSFKLLSTARDSPSKTNGSKEGAVNLARNHCDSADTGSIIDSAARAWDHRPRNNGFFAGTSLLSSFFSNPRTRAPFKPQKSSRGTSSWQLKQYAEATLGSGSLRKAVKLPEGEDKDEWLAVNGET